MVEKECSETTAGLIDTGFGIDLIAIAKETWNVYINNIRKTSKKEEEINTVNFEELEILLSSVGIVKNDAEILQNIAILTSTHPQNFTSNTTFTESNYIDIVESFRNNRIDEKLLCHTFQIIDADGTGEVDLEKLMKVNSTYKLGLMKTELLDILNFFNKEDKVKPGMTYEEFVKLYYQG